MSPTATRNVASQSAGLALYALTLAAHVLSGFARGFITFIVLWFIGVLTGWPIPANTVALIVAFAPLAVSLLSQLCPPQLWPLRSLPFRGLLWVASGQAVTWFTANAWEMYWRSREFAADEYAARLGQGGALAQSLRHDSLPYERSIHRMRFSRASHPYTKPRIARLQTLQTAARAEGAS
jgi:Zn-dependent protease with chaperone function